MEISAEELVRLFKTRKDHREVIKKVADCFKECPAMKSIRKEDLKFERIKRYAHMLTSIKLKHPDYSIDKMMSIIDNEINYIINVYPELCEISPTPEISMIYIIYVCCFIRTNNLYGDTDCRIII